MVYIHRMGIEKIEQNTDRVYNYLFRELGLSKVDAKIVMVRAIAKRRNLDRRMKHPFSDRKKMEQNKFKFEDNNLFMEIWADYVKTHNPKEWSEIHAKFINTIYSKYWQ